MSAKKKSRENPDDSFYACFIRGRALLLSVICISYVCFINVYSSKPNQKPQMKSVNFLGGGRANGQSGTQETRIPQPVEREAEGPSGSLKKRVGQAESRVGEGRVGVVGALGSALGRMAAQRGYLQNCCLLASVLKQTPVVTVPGSWPGRRPESLRFAGPPRRTVQGQGHRIGQGCQAVRFRPGHLMSLRCLSWVTSNVRPAPMLKCVCPRSMGALFRWFPEPQPWSRAAREGKSCPFLCPAPATLTLDPHPPNQARQ